MEWRARVIAANARLQAARLQLELDDGPLAEREAIDEETLHRDHWRTQRPVIVRGAASSWPAARWTFEDLRRRFAYAPVDALVRDGPAWWRAARKTRRLPFGDLVAAALGPPSDALYADGYSGVLEQAGLAPLRAELGTLPGLTGDGHPRAWVGPAGTVTPTHTDQSCGWNVQLVGRKRWWLAAPVEPALLGAAEGLFAVGVAPGGPEARWYEVVLEPGDALFNPVGWWHHVEALSPSISVSFSGFRWPNAFPWYVPG